MVGSFLMKATICQICSSDAPAMPKPGMAVNLMPFLITQNNCRGGALLRHDLEIGGDRLQPLGPLGPVGVGRPAVTIDAADRRVGARAGLDRLGVVEIGRRRFGPVRDDRGAPDARQRPVDDRPDCLAVCPTLKKPPKK